MSNTINDLRSILFDTLKAISDKENPMDLDRAKAINDTAQVIINTAKAEVDFIRAVGNSDTGFIPRSQPALPGSASSSPALPKPEAAEDEKGSTTVKSEPGVTITQHRLGDR